MDDFTDSCTEPFTDVASTDPEVVSFTNPNSAYGLMAWSDDAATRSGDPVEMCGCKAGYEPLLVPISIAANFTVNEFAISPSGNIPGITGGTTGNEFIDRPTCSAMSACSGSDTHCAALRDMHQLYVCLCGLCAPKRLK